MFNEIQVICLNCKELRNWLEFESTNKIAITNTLLAMDHNKCLHLVVSVEANQ